MHLFIFGAGYSGQEIARRLSPSAERIGGTTRSQTSFNALKVAGISPFLFDGSAFGPELAAELRTVTHILLSISPDGGGDPVLPFVTNRTLIDAMPALQWMGYLSTVGVYGDHGGDWVSEATPPKPVSERSIRRVEAEEAWLAFGRATGKTVMIFRLAGIYGPGQNALVNLREGTAKRLVKPGQVFNRIHVEDIAGCIAAGLDRPRAGAVWNVTDDEPAPPQDVVTFAAELLGMEPPPEQAFETAELSPMARSFYGENKRVSNAATKAELGWRLRYPTYREAHRALLAQGDET